MSRQDNWESALKREQGETDYSMHIRREDFQKLQDRSGSGEIHVAIWTSQQDWEKIDREGLPVKLFYWEYVDEDDKEGVKR